MRSKIANAKQKAKGELKASPTSDRLPAAPAQQPLLSPGPDAPAGLVLPPQQVVGPGIAGQQQQIVSHGSISVTTSGTKSS